MIYRLATQEYLIQYYAEIVYDYLKSQGAAAP